MAGQTSFLRVHVELNGRCFSTSPDCCSEQATKTCNCVAHRARNCGPIEGHVKGCPGNVVVVVVLLRNPFLVTAKLKRSLLHNSFIRFTVDNIDFFGFNGIVSLA